MFMHLLGHITTHFTNYDGFTVKTQLKDNQQTATLVEEQKFLNH